MRAERQRARFAHTCTSLKTPVNARNARMIPPTQEYSSHSKAILFWKKTERRIKISRQFPEKQNLESSKLRKCFLAINSLLSSFPLSIKCFPIPSTSAKSTGAAGFHGDCWFTGRWFRPPLESLKATCASSYRTNQFRSDPDADERLGHLHPPAP